MAQTDAGARFRERSPWTAAVAGGAEATSVGRRSIPLQATIKSSCRELRRFREETWRRRRRGPSNGGVIGQGRGLRRARDDAAVVELPDLPPAQPQHLSQHLIGVLPQEG